MSISEIKTMYEKGYSTASIAERYSRSYGISFQDAMKSVVRILNFGWGDKRQQCFISHG